MGRFFIIFSNLHHNWLKFKKIWEKSGDFAQNLMRRHIPTKTKLEYPPGARVEMSMLFLSWENMCTSVKDTVKRQASIVLETRYGILSFSRWDKA